jgi:DNA-binding IclR family transcriptional regulator
VRARGYALTDEELEPGLIAVAAPVYGYDGAVVAALSVSAPTNRMSRDQVAAAAEACTSEAASLSAVLGYRQRTARQTRKAG